MRKNNMKKPEEKEIIVKRYFCGESVAKLASEYEIGVRQIYHWINKYQENGIEGLKSNTDQGSVYSSTSYNNLLNEFNIQRSMSRAGTPTDNPINESLNGWIKEELFIDFNLKHSNDIPNLIKLYIDYYNNERPSYALNYKTPIQFKIESGF